MKFFVDKLYKTSLCTVIILLTITFNYTNTKALRLSDGLDNIMTAEEPRLSPDPPKPLTERELIDKYAKDISAKYGLRPDLVLSIIEQESDFNPNCKTGVCVGLMQINPKYHSDRAVQLGVKNLYDPYGNILVGVDYIVELYNKYKDISLALMCYNMDHQTAKRIYSRGGTTDYVTKVLTGANKYKKGE